ncbi:MAG: PH domain-containing protein [Flavobacteriales bacterium]|nr:PH domain-containing protein [Flavobacteriales bacterium]
MKVIAKAQFNPKIKSYILVIMGLFFSITLFGIPLAIVWFLGLGQWISRKFYESLECELNERHLEYKKGAFFKVEKTIPLENIQDLTFVDNPFLRWFDLRIIKIETAGSSSQNGSDMKLIGIIEAENFKRQVLTERDRLTNKLQTGSSITEGQLDSNTELLTEIRDLLKVIAEK